MLCERDRVHSNLTWPLTFNPSDPTQPKRDRVARRAKQIAMAQRPKLNPCLTRLPLLLTLPPEHPKQTAPSIVGNDNRIDSPDFALSLLVAHSRETQSNICPTLPPSPILISNSQLLTNSVSHSPITYIQEWVWHQNLIPTPWLWVIEESGL